MQLGQDRVIRLAGHVDLVGDAHAAAHVDEDRQTDRRPEIRAQRKDWPDLAVVPHFEIDRAEAFHGSALVVANGGLDRDEIHRAAEELLRFAGHRLRRLRRQSHGNEDEHRYQEPAGIGP